MSHNIACFENIIGLTRTNCSCFPQMNVDGNTSMSDLFLDELHGFQLKTAGAAADCSKGNIWEVLDWARHEAIEGFITELKACVRQQTDPIRPYFNGTLGDEQCGKPQHVGSNTFMGNGMILSNVRGAKLRIKRIGAAFNQTGTLEIKVHDNLNNSPLYIITVNTTANKMDWNSVEGVMIPFDIKERPHKRLYFTYEITGGLKPLEMVVNCGCGNNNMHNVWSWNAPMFSGKFPEDRRYTWLSWMLVNGIYTSESSLTENTNFGNSSMLSGLLFDVEIVCETDSILCNEELDFSVDEVAKVYAHAVRYLAASKTYQHILTQDNLSRYTTKNREYMEEKRIEWLAEYDKRVTGYLCPEIRDKYLNKWNDCLKCRDKNPITKATIQRV